MDRNGFEAGVMADNLMSPRVDFLVHHAMKNTRAWGLRVAEKRGYLTARNCDRSEGSSGGN